MFRHSEGYGRVTVGYGCLQNLFYFISTSSGHPFIYRFVYLQTSAFTMVFELHMPLYAASFYTENGVDHFIKLHKPDARQPPPVPFKNPPTDGFPIALDDFRSLSLAGPRSEE